MNEKDVKNIAKVIVIIAIIFCLLSFVFPWRGFSMNMMGVDVGTDFYPWGGHAYADFGAWASMFNETGGSTTVDGWAIFYTFAIGDDLSESSADTSSSLADTNLAATILMLLSFIFCILTLIFGIITLTYLRKKNSLMPLIAGIMSLLAIILFVIGIEIGLSTDTTGMASQILDWSSGFYLIIVSMILFFVTFAFLKFIRPMPDVMPRYPNTSQQPPGGQVSPPQK